MKPIFKVCFVMLLICAIMSLCAACDSSKDNNESTNPGDASHNHIYGDWTVVTQATCTEGGSRKRTCTVCGYENTETVDPLGHNEVIDAAVSPTCTNSGLTEGKHCSRCNLLLNQQTPLPALGHNYDNGVCTRCGTPEPQATAGLQYTLMDDQTYKVSGYTGSTHDVYIPAYYNDKAVTIIDNRAFYNNSYLRSVEIGSNVTEIWPEAFESCDNLTSVIIPSNVTSIGSEAFSDCRSLTNVTICQGVSSIGDWAFALCRSLKDIIIPDGVTSIKTYVFASCYSLKNVTIPNSVTQIQMGAFNKCTSLLSVTIPSSVTSISNTAFSGCSGLVEVYNKSTVVIEKRSVTGLIAREVYTEPYVSKLSTDENGYSYYTEGDDIILMGYSGDEVNLSLPEGITEIYRYAFYENSSLTSVTIPNSVTKIGSYAFSNCIGITSIIIPDTVTSIEYNTFERCTDLTSITIPNNVTEIGEEAFVNCHHLTSVTIPSSVTSIRNSAFDCCGNLTSITFAGTTEQWYAIDKGTDWDYATGDYTIYCTDGNISK